VRDVLVKIEIEIEKSAYHHRSEPLQQQVEDYIA